MDNADDFEDGPDAAVDPHATAFVVDIDGFEGPIDMLLSLARDQKVDLTQISILQLADQYLEFVALARHTNLELAADYLVMAAWLAYLKSRLLLPDMGSAEEPSGEEMAAALAFQLQRLESMQEAGTRLMARPRLGRDFFARGEPERFMTSGRTIYEVTLYDLLKAYAGHQRRTIGGTLDIEPHELYSVEDALQRLGRMLGGGREWANLWHFLPPDLGDGVKARSAFASVFAASLEMVKEGRMRLRQGEVYGPIFVRGDNGGKGGTQPPREQDDG